MQYRLEKISPAKRQYKFYELSVSLTLLNEWCLVREWGRIGTRGGQRLVKYLPTEQDALQALDAMRRQKQNRGYATIPLQLELI